jgi:rod shape-determining protein MreD
VSYYVAIPLLLLLALLEAAVLPMFPIAGLQPNLVLVLLVAWLMLRGAGEAFVLIPIAGLFIGMVDGAYMGTALLALAPMAFLQEIRGARLSETSFILTVVFTIVMTFVYHLTYLLVFTLAGQSGSWIDAVMRIIAPTALLNVAVLLPFYGVLAMASQQQRRPAYV